MSRGYNFCAGPAVLPDPVIERIQEDLPEYDSLKTSVMEISHRGKPFMEIAAKAEQDLRDLLSVPDNYRVLFLAGGATTQFSMIPLNLAAPDQVCDYLTTGSWGKKSFKEAGAWRSVHQVASGEEQGFTGIPPRDQWQLSENAAYLHYCPNETIAGVEFHQLPEVGDTPLVADMSSNILSRPVDIEQFGLVYAGSQKNIGPSGLAIVIVRDDLVERASDELPGMFSYKVQAAQGSMFNTPPTFPWYVAGLVFEWIKSEGGLDVMAERNQKKSDLLYQYIDHSDFYSNPVEVEARSRMNVPFLLHDDSLNEVFLKESEGAGLLALKGHRSVGGMRASIYNAMPFAGVQALIEFMSEFETRHG